MMIHSIIVKLEKMILYYLESNANCIEIKNYHVYNSVEKLCLWLLILCAKIPP